MSIVKLPRPGTVPAEVQEFCEGLIKNKAYRSRLSVRFLEGTLPTQLETMIWYYAAGKPPEKIEHTFTDETELRNASKDQLIARLEVLKQEASELAEESPSIPDEPDEESIH